VVWYWLENGMGTIFLRGCELPTWWGTLMFLFHPLEGKINSVNTTRIFLVQISIKFILKRSSGNVYRIFSRWKRNFERWNENFSWWGDLILKSLWVRPDDFNGVYNVRRPMMLIKVKWWRFLFSSSVLLARSMHFFYFTPTVFKLRMCKKPIFGKIVFVR
jgi:hypothetical protein